MNPLVNPGAITTTSMVQGREPPTRCGTRSSATYNEFAGRTLTVNQEVYKSESATNQRNQAIAQLMFAYGRIKSESGAGDGPLHASSAR